MPPKNRPFVPPDMAPAVGLRIRKGKFKGIDLDAALPVIANPAEAFVGHKAILFKGLCAWVKRSRNGVAARKAIAKETGRQIAMAETEMAQKLSALLSRKANKKGVSASQKRKIATAAAAYLLATTDEKYRPLYVQVYHHIGGMNAVTDAYKGPPKRHATKRSTAYRYLVAIATILDFHVRELSADPDRYGKPNLLRASKISGVLIKRTGKVGGKNSAKQGLGKSQFSDIFAQHKKAFALLYGADRVAVAGEKTLLDCLLQNKPDQKEIVPHMAKWLSHTKYFCSHVLKNVDGNWESTWSPPAHNSESGKTHATLNVRAHKPLLPELSQEQIDTIKKAFAEKPMSEARPQFKKN
jgi:hypothetical protein